MSQTLKIDNFNSLNIQEETALTADAAISASPVSLAVLNSQGYLANDIFILGTLASEISEKLTVTSIPDTSHINVAALTKAHTKFERITKLFGDKIKVYRAANVDGTVPADANFSVIATVDIDYDQKATVYVDAAGSNAYWYKFTYFNSTTSTQTDIGDSTAGRGGIDNYATIDSIRREAGLTNNKWISDSQIDEKRQTAQAIIDSTLQGRYTVPFTSPINPLIAEITRRLAAGYLLTDDYGPTQTLDTRQGQAKINYVTNDQKTGVLDKLVAKSLNLTDLKGTETAVTETGAFKMWPNNTTSSAPEASGGDNGFGFTRSTRY